MILPTVARTSWHCTSAWHSRHFKDALTSRPQLLNTFSKFTSKLRQRQHGSASHLLWAWITSQACWNLCSAWTFGRWRTKTARAAWKIAGGVSAAGRVGGHTRDMSHDTNQWETDAKTKHLIEELLALNPTAQDCSSEVLQIKSLCGIRSQAWWKWGHSQCWWHVSYTWLDLETVRLWQKL